MLARLLLPLVLICQSQGFFTFIPGMSFFFPPDQSPALREDTIAFPDPPHHLDSHPEAFQVLEHQDPYPQVPHQPSPSYTDCFDEHTRYSKVQYNTSITQHCTYILDRICYPRSEVLCLDVPMTECKLEAGYTCQKEEENNTLRCDTTVEKHLTVKDCVQDRFETLQKIQKTPECKNVTKVNCDSRWIINENGQKVFDKNQNCRDYTWEKCELVDKLVDETQVPVHTCTDREVTYLVPEQVEEEVTSYSKGCETMAGAVCEVFTTTECTTVEWTDCEEVIRPHCETFTVSIPFQEMIKYHRCNVDKNTEHPHLPQENNEDHHQSQENTEYHHLPQENTEYHHLPQENNDDHHLPQENTEYHHQSQENTEYHHLPQESTEYHHLPQENTYHHHQHEEMTEYQPQPEQLIEFEVEMTPEYHLQHEYQPQPEHHHQPEEKTYHHQPEQNTGYHNMPLAPAHLGQHPDTEYSGAITSYHHPSIDM